MQGKQLKERFHVYLCHNCLPSKQNDNDVQETTRVVQINSLSAKFQRTFVVCFSLF